LQPKFKKGKITMANIEKIKCLIIGSGPAGYTAAIYASRANLNPVLYQGEQPGGQLTTTNEVENFPGYPEGVMGTEMMMQLEQQAKRFGADIRNGWVTKVDFSAHPHKVWVDDQELHADAVIIATGASAKYLGLPSEQHYLQTGGGVSACAVCGGFFYRNPKVTMLVRRDEFRASQIMKERVLNSPKIEVLFNTETEEILGDGQVVTGMKVRNNKTGEISEIAITGFFVAIGHKPNTDVFKPYIDTDEVGYIKNVAGTSLTNVAGVFVAGDAADTRYRQAITAAGSGCMAALDAEKYLLTLE